MKTPWLPFLVLFLAAPTAVLAQASTEPYPTTLRAEKSVPITTTETDNNTRAIRNFFIQSVPSYKFFLPGATGTPPATCIQGQLWTDRDAAATSQLCLCTATNTWTCSFGGGGSSIILDLADDGTNESTALSEIAVTGDTNSIFTEPAADKLLIAVGNAWPTASALAANGSNCPPGQWAAGGSATGAAEGCTPDDDSPDSDAEVPNDITAGQLATNGTNCAAGSAARGTDASGNAEDCFVVATGTANVEVSFTAQTSITVTGATHALGHRKIVVACYDAGSPKGRVEPHAVTVDSTSFDVVITFLTAQSGTCVLNGSGGGGSTGWTTTYKTTTETITSDITLSDDATLKFSMLANTKYTFRLRASFDTVDLADFKVALTGPASPTLVAITFNCIIQSTTACTRRMDDGYLVATSLSTAGGKGEVYFEGVIHNGANAGTFAFQWAQNTSNAGNTSVLAGSYVEVKEF